MVNFFFFLSLNGRLIIFQIFKFDTLYLYIQEEQFFFFFILIDVELTVIILPQFGCHMINTCLFHFCFILLNVQTFFYKNSS